MALLNERIVEFITLTVQKYFNGNRIYDSAVTWTDQAGLKKLSNYLHHGLAHAKPLQADVLTDYGNKNSANYKYGETYPNDNSYGSLEEVIKTLYDWEVETKDLLEQFSRYCLEVGDIRTFGVVSGLLPTQTDNIDIMQTLLDAVEAYGNDPKGWLQVSTKLPNILDEYYKIMDGGGIY